MNIFVTSYDPAICAAHLDDQRMVKMCLETAQLLSNEMWVNRMIGPYKLTHHNHPVAVWVRKSPGNYRWLLAHFVALLNEYHQRFGKDHKCGEHLPEFAALASKLQDGEVTPFHNCTPFKEMADVREAYRASLQKKWSEQPRFPRWSGVEYGREGRPWLD